MVWSWRYCWGQTCSSLWNWFIKTVLNIIRVEYILFGCDAPVLWLRASINGYEYDPVGSEGPALAPAPVFARISITITTGPSGHQSHVASHNPLISGRIMAGVNACVQSSDANKHLKVKRQNLLSNFIYIFIFYNLHFTKTFIHALSVLNVFLSSDTFNQALQRPREEFRKKDYFSVKCWAEESGAWGSRWPVQCSVCPL